MWWCITLKFADLKGSFTGLACNCFSPLILKKCVTETRFNMGKKTGHFGKDKLLLYGFTLTNASHHKFSELCPNLEFKRK